MTTYLLDVLPALRRAGVDVAACFLREQHAAADVLRANDVPVWFLHTHRLNPFVVASVARLVRRGGFGVLHCAQLRSSVVGRALARSLGGVRAIVHVHDLALPPAPVRALNRAVADATDLGVCVSGAARDIAVRGYAVSPDRLRVLYTGIDTQVFRPLEPLERGAVRAELGITGTKALCLVGRFQAVKGQLDMIRMLPSLLSRRRDYRLLLVGDGPDRAACERLAAALRVADQCLFLGQRNDVARVLGAADVAVLPSRSEGLSRAAIEANLCGVPAVAYRTGGLGEALPDRLCGALVAPGDAAAFTEAVEQMCTAGEAERCLERARRAARRFGLAGHVLALRACYTELAA